MRTGSLEVLSVCVSYVKGYSRTEVLNLWIETPWGVNDPFAGLT